MDWLWGAIAGALATAAIGGVTFLFNRFVLEPRDRQRRQAIERIRALNELDFLLTLSRDAFTSQNFKAQELLRLIRLNHPDVSTRDDHGEPLGYDEIFHRAYPTLNEKERDIFKLIRGTTLSSLKKANDKMFLWTEEHPEFLAASDRTIESKDFADDLANLRAHLDQWSSKFATWMEDESRSLVYLADEEAHGLGFPTRIEVSLARILKQKS
jgi:hypothetical protein